MLHSIHVRFDNDKHTTIATHIPFCLDKDKTTKEEFIKQFADYVHSEIMRYAGGECYDLVQY